MISEIIRDLVIELDTDPIEINDGNCENFAMSVYERLKEVEILWDFQADEKYGNGDTGWSYNHCFVKYQNKYHDAECPDGVENWIDLPYFKRHNK